MGLERDDITPGMCNNNAESPTKCFHRRFAVFVRFFSSSANLKKLVRKSEGEKAMANLGAPGKTAGDITDELLTFNVENMQNNAKIIYYSRTFMSIVGGVIAGILGFTGLTGFLFYFLVMAITSVGLASKASFSVHSYFDGWNKIIFDGFLGGLLSFVLFWTFAYDLVHIF
ncbi:ER membrane complex subunit 6 isoform X2 [Olea europaea subsp. europaea]|uniref:ER membrane protein complex subunit 6 n=1 Tax=Olea europaea subsp. europaea TaxID=158383 RepID=A0A8S0QVL8_OLEEU|nr:ER membrane complex subunit 6 isoform X2 [Olea europaea subsp. europaea]